MSDIPFGTTDWSAVERTEHIGETGIAYWRTRHFGGIRVRLVEYTPGYMADHWCSKGHILFCLEGELYTELKDGKKFILKPGMSYQVADKDDMAWWKLVHERSVESQSPSLPPQFFLRYRLMRFNDYLAYKRKHRPGIYAIETPLCQ